MKNTKPYLSILANLILLSSIVYLIASFFKKEFFDIVWILNAICTILSIVLFKKMIRDTHSNSIFTLQNSQWIKLIGISYLALGLFFVVENMADSDQIQALHTKLIAGNITSFSGYFLGTIFGTLSCLIKTPALIAGFIFLGIVQVFRRGVKLQQEQDLTIWKSCR